ncbi:MAG: YifB family Mg chelatase-like AAA ATPase [Acidimicrobiia bacterium]|nr:YifB family Mg chelatase-like AAA ATPase [Acidimicrobiia bacterium]
MFASISSAVLFGAEGNRVTVEVHVGKGLPAFHLVGLPDESIRESRDRVRAAVSTSDFEWPDTKITVNLAPSPHRKTGSGLDLAIAVGVLVAAGDLPTNSVAGLGFIGEVGLDGSVRAVPGVAPMVGALGDADVVVPVDNAREARVAASGRVRLVSTLRELASVLLGDSPWPEFALGEPDDPPALIADLADVRGQPLARHAVEIAAAGGHHTLFVGPPGSGKTMLAARLPGLLPDLDRAGALESTMVHSAAGELLPPGGLVTRPPFRAPHHTSSMVALVGGGSHSLRPGEISLAHRGVLFLDEIGEFAPAVLDGLRQPLEEGVIRVARANSHAVLPADFMLAAAMNPCPCGGGPPGECRCDGAALRRYARRLSGPLLDRFDLRVPVHRPAVDDLVSGEPGEPTVAVAERVRAARALALDRQGVLNARLVPRALDELAPLDSAASAELRRRIELDQLSGRGYHRVRRVARTIADLADAGRSTISADDVALALQMRKTFTRRARSSHVA